MFLLASVKQEHLLWILLYMAFIFIFFFGRYILGILYSTDIIELIQIQTDVMDGVNMGVFQCVASVNVLIVVIAL